MTSNTDKLRAVFLTALMIGSVFAAGIAFTGGAAAADGTVSVGSSDVGDGQSLGFTVTDSDYNGDSNTAESVTVAVTSDTEGTQSTTETVGSMGTYTTGSYVYDADGDGLDADDFTIESSGDDDESLTVSSVAADGTASLSLTNFDDSGDSIAYQTANETVSLTESDADSGTFSGSITVANASANAGDGTLQISSDGETITLSRTDASENGLPFDTATSSADLTEVSASNAVSFVDADDQIDFGGDADTDTVVEVTFADDLGDGSSGTAPEASDFIAVTNDGTQVTANNIMSDTDGDAQVLLDLGATNAVTVDHINLSTNTDFTDTEGNAVTLGNTSVTSTSSTISESAGTSSSSARQVFTGENVAILANELNEGIEINTPSQFVFSGSTGSDSQVYVFNTEDRNTSATYTFDFQSNGDATAGTTATQYLGLRSLGLTASADDTTRTTAQTLDGSISSNNGNSDVDVTLLDSSDEELTTKTVTLDGSGEGTFSFAARGSGNAGNYTVEVTGVNTGVTATTDTYVVSSAAEDNAEFVGESRATRGDVATVNVSIEGTNTATVHIGSDANGYEANVTVTDNSGDGYAAFDINTFQMGGAQGNSQYSAGDAFSVVNSDDSISVTQEDVALPRVIASGGYQMSVRSGPNVEDTPQDLNRLYVDAGPSVNSQTIITAPGTYAIGSVATDATLTEDSTVTWKDSPRGDYVVHQFDASGVYGLIDAQGSSSDSFATKAVSAFGTDKLNLTLAQTEATTNQNANPFSVDEAALIGGDDATIVGDAANNTFWVIYDVEAINDHASDSVDFGDGINATVELSAKSNLTTSDVSLSSEYQIAEEDTELTFDGDAYTVSNASNQTISGTTNLADGTNLTVTATSVETQGDGFIKPVEQLTVENGEFSGSFDFSDTNVNDTFTISVSDSQGNGLVSGTSGIVVESVDDGETTTTEAPDTTTEAPDTTTEAPDTTTEAPDTTTEAPQTTESMDTTEAMDTTTEEDDSSGGSIPGFGVGIALVAVLGAALLALRE